MLAPTKYGVPTTYRIFDAARLVAAVMPVSDGTSRVVTFWEGER